MHAITDGTTSGTTQSYAGLIEKLCTHMRVNDAKVKDRCRRGRRHDKRHDGKRRHTHRVRR